MLKSIGSLDMRQDKINPGSACNSSHLHMAEFIMNLLNRGSAVLSGLMMLTGASSMPALAAMHQNAPSAIVAPQAAKANCGNARICALVTGAGGLSRAKNVTKVTHPATGIYCLTPKSGVVTLSQVTPLTTIEWGSSSGNNCRGNRALNASVTAGDGW